MKKKKAIVISLFYLHHIQAFRWFYYQIQDTNKRSTKCGSCITYSTIFVFFPFIVFNLHLFGHGLNMQTILLKAATLNTYALFFYGRCSE